MKKSTIFGIAAVVNHRRRGRAKVIFIGTECQDEVEQVMSGIGYGSGHYHLRFAELRMLGITFHPDVIQPPHRKEQNKHGK